MIIIEGCDGTGKTTLIKGLVQDCRLEQHSRASDSIKGPVSDLFAWAYRDVRSWSSYARPMIYDRHPFISEYIYGPMTRNTIPRSFINPGSINIWREFVSRSLIIICQPPLSVVLDNLKAEDQMSGVLEHAEGIWSQYAALERAIPVLTYDYTQQHAYQGIKAAVRLHIAQWRRYQ